VEPSVPWILLQWPKSRRLVADLKCWFSSSCVRELVRIFIIMNFAETCLLSSAADRSLVWGQIDRHKVGGPPPGRRIGRFFRQRLIRDVQVWCTGAHLNLIFFFCVFWSQWWSSYSYSVYPRNILYNYWRILLNDRLPNRQKGVPCERTLRIAWLAIGCCGAKVRVVPLNF
jgi:hypothetical protein